MFEPCSGCRAEFLPHDGPTQRYIIAHAGCWALYSAVVSTADAPPDLLRASRVAQQTRAAAPTRGDLAPLLVDADAAQLEPPPRDAAVALRELWEADGQPSEITSSAYVTSVFDTWRALHRGTVDEWFDRYVEEERE